MTRFLRLGFLLFMLCCLPGSASAQQKLDKARQSSYLTKIFRLTDAQTRYLYEKGIDHARPDFFTQPVDSFPSDRSSRWRPRPLPSGYYLVAHTEGSNLVYWLRAETDREVVLLDNQIDLTVLIRDSLGHLLTDATVELAHKPVPFDAATQTYRLARKGKVGLLAVTHAGRTTFHALDQTFPRRSYEAEAYGQQDEQDQPGAFRSMAVRVGRRVLYGFPLGLLTRPMWRLGRDLKHVSSVPTGLIGLVRSPFSENVRDQRQEQRLQHRQRRANWASYLVFSQPRYRPTGDTLRLKARLLRRPDGRPCRQSLTLWLGGGNGTPEKKLTVLRPVRPGSYEFTLPLTDTLGLHPDTYVAVRLANKAGATLASGTFRLEDYELSNTRYSLRVAEKKHLRGLEQAVFLRGADANELNLLDARVRLSLTPTAAPTSFPSRQVFVPDTLWTHAQPLDPSGETRVELPARLFPPADFSYDVQAVFLNSDNERHTQSATVPYTLDTGQLTIELQADSVQLRYLSLGKSVPHAATLKVSNPSDLGPGYWFDGPVQLPLTLPVNPQADYYSLADASNHRASLDLDETNGGLELRSERTHDSLFVVVDNPRRVAFWYYIYRGNRLMYRGYGPALQLAVPAHGKEPWYASVHYLWGEEMRTAEYTMVLPQKQLVVQTEQPEVAYPGQQVRLNFLVTDGGGRPVPHADLTAYAYTSKFKEPKAPPLPSFEPAVQGRLSLRRFALSEEFDEPEGRQLLVWAQWRHQLGLDSLQFYRFLYPEYGSFYEYRPAPGGLAQIAPFVVDSGRVEAPIAVYIDGQPVYIHDVNQQEPYAMVADSGHHSLAIRTATRFVLLQDVYLRPLHKLTLSIDVNYPCAGLLVEKRLPALSPAEHLALSRTLLSVENEWGAGRLRQGQVLRPLGSSRISGPFRPDSVLFRSGSGLRRKFQFEPLYRYTFGPQLLKMSCLDPAAFGPLTGSGFNRLLPLSDFALLEADFEPRRNPQTGLREPSRYVPAAYEQQPVLIVPTQTLAGQGRLEIRLPARTSSWDPTMAPNVPRYILLTRADQPKFLRLQPAHQLLAHALPPGRYRVVVLMADSTCLAPTEEAVVEKDGLTCFQLLPTDRRPAGALSRRIARLVRERVPKLTPPSAMELRAARREITVQTPPVPRPDWRQLRGRVTDASTGEGLPGVTVLLKGTNVGVSTAADGSFTLQVPWTGSVLVFSSVGYMPVERPIESNQIYVALGADSKQLSEVVVVGYGTQRRYELTGSVSTIVSNSLQGRVAGVAITTATGGTRVQIRGSSSVAASTMPLLILDGLPYNGRLEDLDPALIASVKTITGPEAAGLYGARAAAGVLIISTKSGVNPSDDAGRDPRLALRSRFSDYAWWRPTLVTDAQGRASTTVTLPDDVTGWDTFVLGSDDHGRTGSATGLLRSFKALRVELAVPRFLIEGDQVQVLGKTLNYLPDTTQVQTSFRVGEKYLQTQTHRMASVALDTLTVTAPAVATTDSLQVTFNLQQTSTNYQDGEQRRIPVLPAGTQERTGTFAVLASADTTLTMPIDPARGEVTVRLESDALPILLSEIEHLQQYAYLCNEQAASKLKALLLEQRIREYQKAPFKGTRAINFLIRKLQEGRHKPEGLWGTWPTSPVSPWATTHVLEALLSAEQAGYKVKFDRDQVQRYLLKQLDEGLSATETRATATQGYYYAPQADEQIRLLHLLRRLGVSTDYATYISRLDRVQARQGRQPLDRYLALVHLRQQLGLPYQLDTLRRYRLQNQLGGVWYDDTLRQGSYYRYLLPQRVGTTLLAYQVLRAKGGREAELTRIRTFLLNLRQTNHWRSTYEAAQILETIGPDLLSPGQASFSRVQLEGAIQQEVKKFPFEAKLPATAGPLLVHKEGLLPVYATAYQTQWNPTPAATAAPFVVRTTLAGQEGNQVALTAGKPTELVVTVEVKAEARYVLLEVPIPAGCSYGEKLAGNSFEVHREYLRHQTGIFMDVLPIGRHTFRIALQPRYRGHYTVNPAKAELMYFPTRFGRSASKQAVVK